MNSNKITIFTDGSSRGNPGPGGFAFVTAFPDTKGEFHIEEGGGKEVATTNNRMEMRAVVQALKYFDGYYSLEQFSKISFHIYLDSSYVLKGITQWVFGWEKNNWITSQKEKVMNEDLWRQLREVTTGKKIEWHLLKGHSGIVGNERCDVIATAFADAVRDPQSEPQLFKGKVSEYPYDILKMESNGMPVSSSKGKKAYSYVSSIGGKVMIHKTWAECEARVKGEKRAKFKKALSERDEEHLIHTLGKV